MKIGYQLFSALDRCRTAQDLADTVRELARMGYDGVEFFDYAGIPAGEMKALLAACGVEAVNSHVSLDRWEKNLDGEIRYAVEAGIPMLTIPWLPPELRTAETYRRIAANLPGWTAQCAESGVQACYHNHDFEYAKLGNSLVLDTILGAEPKLSLQLDTFWAMYAGFDPVEQMQAHSARLRLIHIKDYLSLETKFPQFCAIGTGRMDNAPILRQAAQMGLEWVVVEQDNSQIDVMDSARLSLENLHRALG